LHGITTPYDKAHYQEGIKSVLKDYLAIGLDPKKSILTVQSQVPQHIELAYLFSSVTTIAKMTHLPTFKEKVKQYPEHSLGEPSLRQYGGVQTSSHEGRGL